MKSNKNKALSLLLSIALIAGLLTGFATEPVAVQAQEEATIQDILGDQWSLGWGAEGKYGVDHVEVVQGQAKYGKHSLRIGHPEKATAMTLNLTVPVTNADYKYGLWLKSEGTVATGSTLYVFDKDGTNAAVTRQTIDYGSSITSEWSQLENSIVITTGYLQIDIWVECDAASYVYIDDIYVADTTNTGVPILADNSFERWSLRTNNVGEAYGFGDFCQYVTAPEGGSGRALRIGNEYTDTDIVLELHQKLYAEATYRAYADVYIETNEEGQGLTEGRFRFDENYVDDFSENTEKQEYILTGREENKWIKLGSTPDDNGQYGEAPAPAAFYGYARPMKFTIHVKCPVGTYLYLDNFVLYKSNYNNTVTPVNIFPNAGCEYGLNEDPLVTTVSPEVGEELGAEWDCIENAYSSVIPSEDFVSVVDTQANTGLFSLKVGHEKSPTNMTLRVTLPATAEDSYQYSVWLKSSTTVNVGSVTIGDNSGNSGKTYDFASVVNNSSWTELKNADGEENATILQAAGNQLYVDIHVECDEGEYLYIDDLQIVNSASLITPLLIDSGFERWTVKTNNAGSEYGMEDFCEYVAGPEGGSGRALRIGNETVATDLVLQFYQWLPTNYTTNPTVHLRTDFYVETNDAGEGVSSGTKFYFANSNASNEGNKKSYDISSASTGTWLTLDNTGVTGENSSDKTAVWYGNGSRYQGAKKPLYFTITVKCPAGTYLYVDNFGFHFSDKCSSGQNLFPNNDFEFGEIPRKEIVEVNYVSALRKPTNWATSWSEHEEIRNAYLTTDAHTGEYALAITAAEKEMAHTYKQGLYNLEANATYTFEGYFKKTGEFSSYRVFHNDGQGGGNQTILQMASSNMPEYTAVTGTFQVADTDTILSLYAVSKQGGIMYADDLVVYKSDDATKTNLLKNGDFESTEKVSGEAYKLSKSFTTLPGAVQAKIRLNANTEKTSESGVILGNFDGFNQAMNIGVTTYGRPYVYFLDETSAVTEVIFNDVNVCTGKWIGLQIVRETNQFHCYVNGELKQTVEHTVADYSCTQPFAVGSDLRGEKFAFVGDIENITVYADAGMKNVLAAWDLQKLGNLNIVTDKSTNGYHGARETSWSAEVAIPEKYTYSFAVVGDTQYVTRKDMDLGNEPGTAYLGGLYDWIVENKDSKNIQFVMGMGDITDQNRDDEWSHAEASIRKLSEAGIPYSLVEGNHDGFDGYVAGVITEGATEKFDNTLTALNYTTQSTYKGTYEATNSTLANSYHEIQVGTTKWLIITLDYVLDENEMAWANQVVQKHPEHQVIITTHAYMHADATWTDASYDVDAEDGLANTLAGEETWKQLVSKHANIKLLLCGHHFGEDVVVNKRQGDNGNIVTEMLIDTQTIDQQWYLASTPQPPLALVTLLHFTEDGSEVMVSNYSTGRDRYYHPNVELEADLYPNYELEQLKDYAEETIADLTPYEVQDLINNAEVALTNAATDEDRNAVLTTAKANVDILGNALKLNVGGRQVRETDTTLRFVLELDDSFYAYMNSLYENVEFGTLLARGDMYTGAMEYSDVTKGFSTEAASVVKRESTYNPDNYTAQNQGDTTVYTCVVRKIPEAYHDMELRARNYLKYTDASGVEHVIYGQEYSATYADTLAASTQ